MSGTHETPRRGADGEPLHRVRIDWFPVTFWFTAGQWRAVARLYDAMDDDTPRGEVGEAELLRVSRSGSSSVRVLFVGSPALGRLVLHGTRPHTYRLTPKPQRTP